MGPNVRKAPWILMAASRISNPVIQSNCLRWPQHISNISAITIAIVPSLSTIFGKRLKRL